MLVIISNSDFLAIELDNWLDQRRFWRSPNCLVFPPMRTRKTVVSHTSYTPGKSRRQARPKVLSPIDPARRQSMLVEEKAPMWKSSTSPRSRTLSEEGEQPPTRMLSLCAIITILGVLVMRSAAHATMKPPSGGIYRADVVVGGELGRLASGRRSAVALRSSRSATARFAWSESTLCFIDIPGSGGSAIRQTMSLWTQNLGMNFAGPGTDVIALSPAEQGAIAVIFEHGHGIERDAAYAGRPIEYATVLRDPLDRVFAQFDRRRIAAETQQREVPRFVDWFRAWETESDPATRALCCFRGKRDGLNCAASLETLACAKRNLNAMAVVGIHDRLDESIALILWTLDVGAEITAMDLKLMQREMEPIGFEPTSEDLAAVHNARSLDLELYMHAEALFRTSIKEMKHAAKVGKRMHGEHASRAAAAAAERRLKAKHIKAVAATPTLRKVDTGARAVSVGRKGARQSRAVEKVQAAAKKKEVRNEAKRAEGQAARRAAKEAQKKRKVKKRREREREKKQTAKQQQLQLQLQQKKKKKKKMKKKKNKQKKEQKKEKQQKQKQKQKRKTPSAIKTTKDAKAKEMLKMTEAAAKKTSSDPESFAAKSVAGKTVVKETVHASPPPVNITEATVRKSKEKKGAPAAAALVAEIEKAANAAAAANVAALKVTSSEVVAKSVAKKKVVS